MISQCLYWCVYKQMLDCWYILDTTRHLLQTVFQSFFKYVLILLISYHDICFGSLQVWMSIAPTLAPHHSFVENTNNISCFFVISHIPMSGTTHKLFFRLSVVSLRRIPKISWDLVYRTFPIPFIPDCKFYIY